jgi:hypothetical protein
MIEADLKYENLIFEKELIQEPKNKFMNKVLNDIEYISERTDKTRDNISWEKNVNYYFLHPEKFNFGLRDL